MTRLKAQNKELHIRPPVEEFAAAHFGYARPVVENDGELMEGAESELPEFEP
jgi:hypothetical protein